MKQYRFIIYALAMGLFLFGCKKEIDSPDENENEQIQEDDYDTYFSGKVNGEEFQYNGSWNCVSIYGNYYPEGYLDFQGGYFNFRIANCESSEGIYLGKFANLHEGVFTSTDTSETDRPWCTFADHDYDFVGSNGQSTVLRADDRIEIRLEITNIEHIEEYDDYYVEGLLDAVVRDTIVDSTIVISDVEFGYKF